MAATHTQPPFVFIDMWHSCAHHRPIFPHPTISRRSLPRQREVDLVEIAVSCATAKLKRTGFPPPFRMEVIFHLNIQQRRRPQSRSECTTMPRRRTVMRIVTRLNRAAFPITPDTSPTVFSGIRLSLSVSSNGFLDASPTVCRRVWWTTAFFTQPPKPQ